jgi:hypothetical protein
MGLDFEKPLVEIEAKIAASKTGRRQVAAALAAVLKSGDGSRVNERLVALHVDDQVTVQPAGNLGEPVGAGGVVGARHRRAAAEFLNRLEYPLVVGRHDNGF